MVSRVAIALVASALADLAAPSPSPSASLHSRRRRRTGQQCTEPKGPVGGPEQFHIALGGDPSELSVTFASSLSFGKPSCSVEGLGVFQGSSREYTDGGWQGLLHTVLLTGLKPATKYRYDCGAGGRELRTAPEVGKLPVTIAAVADLGMNCARQGCGNATIERLNMMAAADEYDLLLHAGDIAYTSGLPCVWDDFFRELETSTSRLPYMVAVGNHEHYYNFSGYRQRFRMPGAESNENLWYSFDYGGVHVAAFSTQHDLGLQTEWLRADLSRAAANRAQVPWILVMAHKPLYCSTKDYNDCEVGCKKIAAEVEQLLSDFGVDLFLAGHLHNYERTWPVVNGSVEARSYVQPGAPVHLVIGNAGDDEGLTDSWLPAPVWRAAKNAQLGFGRIEANSSALRFDLVLSESGHVADSFVITKGAMTV